MGSQGGGGGFGKMGRPGQNQNAAQQNSQSSVSKGGSNTINGAAEPQGGMQPPDGIQSQNQNQSSGGNQLPNGAPSDGNRTGNEIPSSHGMPGFENMPDSEIMMQAIQIIQSANGKELSEEQLNRLKELGLTEEQIANVQRIVSGFGKGGIGVGADMQRGGGGPLQNGRITMGAKGNPSRTNGVKVAALSVCVAAWAAGFIFVVKFRRKKLSR
jgi:hypothetical protein